MSHCCVKCAVQFLGSTQLSTDVARPISLGPVLRLALFYRLCVFAITSLSRYFFPNIYIYIYSGTTVQECRVNVGYGSVNTIHSAVHGLFLAIQCSITWGCRGVRLNCFLVFRAYGTLYSRSDLGVVMKSRHCATIYSFEGLWLQHVGR